MDTLYNIDMNKNIMMFLDNLSQINYLLTHNTYITSIYPSKIKYQILKCEKNINKDNIREIRYVEDFKFLKNYQYKNLTKITCGENYFVSYIYKLENLQDNISITDLDISYTRINVLENLPKKLISLNLQFCEIDEIREYPNTLTKLILAYTKFPINMNTIFPENLTYLDLTDSRLPQIENLINLPRNLEILIASNASINKLENIPRTMKKIIIDKTNIKVIHDLPETLQYLDIYYTSISKLEKIPSSLTFLKTTLNLNDIGKLPINLKTLYISGSNNYLYDLPISLEKLVTGCAMISKIENLPKKLKYLDISYNKKIRKLENLPDTLTYLNISHTNITKLENLPDTLSYLNITRAKIEKLENLPKKLEVIEDFFLKFNMDSTDLPINCKIEKYKKIDLTD